MVVGLLFETKAAVLAGEGRAWDPSVQRIIDLRMASSDFASLHKVNFTKTLTTSPSTSISGTFFIQAYAIDL
jgi:hypothetical protein